MTSSSNCSYQKYSIIDVKSQCIDGTRAAYYIRFTTNPTSKQKWHIHFEGGGWCYNLKNCDDRSKTLLGSSKDYTNCLTLNFMNTSYFSIKKEKNPLLYNYNVVYVRYCDGGSFAGNKIQNYQVNFFYFLVKSLLQSLRVKNYILWEKEFDKVY